MRSKSTLGVATALMLALAPAAHSSTLLTEDFQTNISAWSVNADSAAIVAAPGGGNALVFTKTWSNGDLFSKSTVASTTRSYTISFDIYGACGRTSQCGFFFGTYYPGGVTWFLSDDPLYPRPVVAFSDSNGSWEQVSYTFSDGNNVNLVFEDFSGAAGSGKDSFYLRNLLMTDNSVGLAVGALTVTGVPEPSSWALMLAGFAALGFAASRRNKPVVAPTSA